jgi:hypothetical protein
MVVLRVKLISDLLILSLHGQAGVGGEKRGKGDLRWLKAVFSP